MSRLFQAASAVAVSLTAMTAIFLNVPGMAQSRTADLQTSPSVAATATVTEPSSAPMDQPRTDLVQLQHGDASPDSDGAAVDSRRPVHASLVDAVAADDAADADADLHCLAAGVYYEANGEPLEGQLAVAHVILTRMASGRFAPTACGVLTQRGQFSFVRGGGVPTPPAGRSWHTALAIARIARDGSWHNPAPGAMYFHAARVAPSWNRARVTQLGHHIFYR